MAAVPSSLPSKAEAERGIAQAVDLLRVAASRVKSARTDQDWHVVFELLMNAQTDLSPITSAIIDHEIAAHRRAHEGSDV